MCWLQGITPAEVRVLGIDGGAIAGLEDRMALAVGAPVGILRGSGREAGKVLRDASWVTAPNLIALEPDADDVRKLLT